jgi:Flp pilus assembly protein TadG
MTTDSPLRRALPRVREETGQALVELAIVLPILFLLIAGILEFGRAYNIQQIVVDASREGSRMAVVADAAVDSAAVKARINKLLADNHLDSTKVGIAISPSADWKKTGQAMTVQVTYPFKFKFVAALMDWATGSTAGITLSGTTTMRNE